MQYEDVIIEFQSIFNKCESLNDKYKLCFEIYNFDNEKHPEWSDLIRIVEKRSSIISEITKDIKSPEKEYLLVKTYTYKPGFEIKGSYTLEDDNVYDSLLCLCEDEFDKQIIKASRLAYLSSVYRYYEAEDIAEELYKCNLILECVKTLSRYYMQTRRYDRAIELCNKHNKDGQMDELIKDISDRQSGNKKEYKPGKKENIDIYNEFLGNCVGINIERNKDSKRDRIENCDYPEFEFIDDMNFNSFVAYDLETSGLSRKFDYITEIGAIKVVDGKVVDSKKYKFQELVHPYGKPKKISLEAKEKTGITDEMVAEARDIKEVFNDFADFIGDDILVGYNNKRFDSAMLRRAGRYAKRIIKNKQLDLLPIAKEKTCLCDTKLNTVAKSFGIENPQAHRAYADAITTARLFLTLKRLEKEILFRRND